MRWTTVVALAALAGAALWAEEGKERAFKFSKDDVGKVPAGWKAEQTGRGLDVRDAPAVAVKQTHAERMFEICDGTGDRGLSGVQKCRRFAHAARLHDRHQDMKVMQFHSAADAIAYLH